MPRTLYVASTNAGKLRDFAVAARSHEVSIVPLPGLNNVDPAPEEEDTFEGNARQKAAYYSKLLRGEVVLADDSGLEVDFLNGAPGVRSARYAADAGFDSGLGLDTDSENNLYLLQQLSGVAERERAARYRCVLAAARDGDVLLTGHGSVAGSILAAPRGRGGFGYDPLFYLPELDRTMAEIDLETKYLLSHRGAALRSLLAQFGL